MEALNADAPVEEIAAQFGLFADGIEAYVAELRQVQSQMSTSEWDVSDLEMPRMHASKISEPTNVLRDLFNTASAAANTYRENKNVGHESTVLG